MTLWKKILITVALVLVGSGVVLYLAARFIVLSGYLRLEDAYMQENAQRAATSRRPIPPHGHYAGRLGLLG
jgi:sensor domain CHASE-containing protein